MKISIGDKDISQLLEKVTWSGDTKQVARKISFTIAKKQTDYYLPKITINIGDKILMQTDSGKTLFYGVIWDVDRKTSSSTVSYVAFDFLIYITKSDINAVYNTTPEEVVKRIAQEFAIPTGKIAQTGIRVYMPCFGKGAYETIMMGYTAASKQNGKKYIPLIQDRNKLSVIEKGSLCGVIMDSTYNLQDSSYKQSLDNMVNKVIIKNSDGKVLGTVTKASPDGGTIQKVYTQEDGKNAQAEAKAMLKVLEETASVSGIGDVRALSGYALIIQEETTGLYGRFYIESDTHTFEKGVHTMQLTLEFDNLMDEKEIPKESEGS